LNNVNVLHCNGPVWNFLKTHESIVHDNKHHLKDMWWLL